MGADRTPAGSQTKTPASPLAGGAGALSAAERRLTLVRGAPCSDTTDSSPIQVLWGRDRPIDYTNLATTTVENAQQ
jgi:hypothetical protein